MTIHRLRQAADALAEVDLTSPATTLALQQLDAVVGLRGTVTEGGLTSIGITCAPCHSAVDDRLAPGIGRRLDGWADRDLNPGVIMILGTGSIRSYRSARRQRSHR
ncbi:MAG: hypothetical protein WBG92_09350 [Thiohalocapsa sp.]